MLLEFKIDGASYDYRQGEVGGDGLYWLDSENKTYTLVESVSTGLQAKVDAEVALALAIENQRLLNIESLAYLASTDWYVTRFTESGVAVPADVTQARTDARLAVV